LGNGNGWQGRNLPFEMCRFRKQEEVEKMLSLKNPFQSSSRSFPYMRSSCVSVLIKLTDTKVKKMGFVSYDVGQVEGCFLYGLVLTGIA